MTRILVWAAAAVALRLSIAMATREAGIFADMEQYHDRAVHLLTTGTLFPDALRGPGYPLLLATMYSMIGESPWSARLANALLGGALTLLTGMLAQKAGAAGRAWLASAVVAVYPALVLSSVYLMPEGFYTVLAALCLLLVGHRGAAFALAAGVVAGVAILTRSVGTALFAAPVLVWSDAVRRGRAGWPLATSRLGLFVAACVVTLAPWLLFTSRVAGGPLLDATSGFNLLAGNNPRATGRLEMRDEPWLRQTYLVGASSAADVNARGVAAGVAWARDNPGPWLRLAAAKLAYLFGLEGREHAWGYGNSYFGERSPLTLRVWGGVLLASFPLLCLAAAVGLSRATGPLLPVHIAMLAFVVASAMLHVVSFGESRFHLPLVPFMAVAASLGAGTRAVVPLRARTALLALLLVALAAAWIGQARELGDRLSRLRQPGGWSSHLEY